MWVLLDAVEPLGGDGVGGDRHVTSALFHTPLAGSAVTIADTRKVALSIADTRREVFIDIWSANGHNLELIDEKMVTAGLVAQFDDDLMAEYVAGRLTVEQMREFDSHGLGVLTVFDADGAVVATVVVHWSALVDWSNVDE